MSTAGTSFLISQLGYQAPALLVYLGAAVLAFVYMSRATTPSVLTMIGAGILVATAIGTTVIQAFLIGSETPEMSRLWPVIGAVSSCFSALGLGLLVAAIFVGRDPVNRTRGRYLEEDE